MEAKNISGNTPLHVAATRNTLGCAKFLLLRGAKKDVPNKANQTPGQVAILSQSNDVAELIARHPDDFCSKSLFAYRLHITHRIT